MGYKKELWNKLLEGNCLDSLDRLITRSINKKMSSLKEKDLIDNDFEVWSDLYYEYNTNEEEPDNIFCSIYCDGGEEEIEPLDLTIYYENNNVYCDDLSEEISSPPELGIVDSEGHLAELIAKRAVKDIKERLGICK